MITPGSYWFIRGTNIEVGIRKVSHDEMHPYAACVFRYGRYRWNHAQKRMYSRRDPIHLQVQKIPFACLTKYCDFNKRNRLKNSFRPGDPCPLDAPIVKEVAEEGLYVDKCMPYHDVIHKKNNKYFVLLKSMTKHHFTVGEHNVYSIYGLKELTFPFKYWDSEEQVVVFDTEPIRKAHISVVRPYKSMAHLGGHTQRWNVSWKRISPRGCNLPVDMAYIAGTSIVVHTLIQNETISFCKMNTYYNNYDILTQWIPNVELTTYFPRFLPDADYEARDMKRISSGYLSHGVYVNGLPYRYTAAVPEGHPLLHSDQRALLEEQKKLFPLEEYFEEQKNMLYIYLYPETSSNQGEYLDKDCTKWRAYLSHISVEPSPSYMQLSNWRQDDSSTYLEDYRNRSNNTMFLQPVAVKV